ncbi:hypothetical protein BST40_21790 [Mycobacterium persicum]|nr:hypothetical protein BST40_21790 [Mycobacterium persicum]
MPLADARARAERVVYLRAVAGLSWSKIRDELGFKSVGAAQQAYKAHQRRNPPPSSEAVFAELLERNRFRSSQGTVALARAQAAGDHASVASLLRALASNDAELARWFAIGSDTLNVNINTTATQIIAEARERLLAVVDAEVVDDPKEIER